MSDRRPTSSSGSTIENASYLLQGGNRSLLLHLLFVFFAGFTLFMSFYHVPFRDEAQPWLFARDLDWQNLFYVTRHYGHPLLWLAAVKILYQLGLGYMSVMVLNWALCVWGIWLLFYRSGLPLAARVCFAYAPECLLELGYTARDYALAIPLCFLAALFYKDARQRPLRFSIVLALLASANVYAAAVFLGLWFQFVLDQACDFGLRNFSLRAIFTRYLVPNLILALGAISLFLELAPIHFPADPFPNVTSHLAIVPSRLLSPRLLVAMLPWLVLTFLPRSPARPPILAIVPTFLLVSIPVVAYGTYARHYFMLGLGVAYLCWVYYERFRNAESVLSAHWKTRMLPLIVTLLLILVSWGPKPRLYHGYPGKMDGRNAAYAITRAGLDRPDTLLLSTDPFATMSLLPYLEGIRGDYVPPMFGPSPQSFAYDAYVRYSRVPPSLESFKPLVLDYAQKNPGKTILVVETGPSRSDYPSYGPDYRLEPLYFSPADQNPLDEGYQIYRLRPVSHDTHP